MKKITFLLLLLLVSMQAMAQVLNQPANWPNTDWTITGTFVAGAPFLSDPTLTPEFSYDDDEAGNAAINTIAAESPVIDLTAAFNAGETWVFVNTDYVFQNFTDDTVALQYWDADTSTWVNWFDPIDTDTPGAPFQDYCAGPAIALDSGELSITNFTATQLSGFKYRFFFDDNGAWGYGFCFQSPTISSQTPPSCLAVSDVTGTVTGTTVNITWSAGGDETNWEYVNQLAGGTAPTDSDSGTSIATNSVELMTLTEGEDYEFYVRADCGTDDGFGIWVGPFTYSITGPGETCENPIIVASTLPYSTDDDTSNYGDNYNGSPGTSCNATSSYLGGDDVVYSYTAATDTTITITLTPGGTWSGLFVYTDCADIGVECTTGIANSSSNIRELEVPVTAGTTYYIVISTWPAPQSITYNLTITENTCTDPVATYAVINDCDVAPQFFVEATVTDIGTATSLILTDNQGSAAQTTDVPGTFTFGPFPNGTDVIVTIANDGDANCIINSGSLTQQACPPDNDLCVDAFPIACGESDSGNTSAANDTGAPTGTCGTGGGAPGVWYTFTGSGEIVTASLCNSTYDTKIQVYQGSCDALVCVTGNDDSCGLQSSVDFVTEAGTIYYFYVYGFGSGTGAYTIDVSCVELPDPPTNDECQTAIVASVNPGESCDLVTSGTIYGATPSDVPAGSCTGTPNDDVWFQFTALGEQQIIQIQNFGIGTTNLDHAVYEGSCDGLVELYCSTDNFSLTPNLTIGSTYYVRVFTAGTALETTTFDLCIQTLGTPTYCLDALPICAEGGLIYPSVVGDDIAPPYIDYGCLGSQPDPIWNTIFFDLPGDYTFTLAQTGLDGVGNDIDFIIWGPFNDQQGGCVDLLPENIADCSFSGVSIETIELTNVQAGDVFVILITNFSQEDGTYTFTQESGPTNGTNCEIVCDVVIEYQDSPIMEDPDNLGFGDPIELCGETSIVLSANSPYANFYEWYLNGFAIPDSNTDTITATESGVYQVIANGDVCEDLAFSLQVQVTLGVSPVANAVDDIVTCDDVSGDGFEEFDLESQTATILGTQDSSLVNVTYHLSQTDAITNTGALSSPYTNISNPQTIWVRTEDADATFCIAITSFNLVISGPTPTATAADITLCDDTSGDGFVPFNLTDNDVNILNGQSATDFTVTYYLTEADANAGTGALTSPYTNTTNPQTIWARVDNDSAVDCYAIIDFDLIAGELPVTTFATDFEYQVCPNATQPIFITATPQNYAASEVTIVWYQDGGVIEGENDLVLPVLTGGLYEIEVTFNQTGCTDTVSQNVIELESCVIPQGISPNGDMKNDTFDLRNFDVTRLEIYNRNGTLVYSKDNYTNEWVGQADNGDELPVGTYFYTMIYEGGAKTKSSWVYLNK